MRQRHMGNGPPFGPGAPMTGMPIFGAGRGGRGRGRGAHHGGDMRLPMHHPAHHPMHHPEWAQGKASPGKQVDDSFHSDSIAHSGPSWPGGWNPAAWNGPGHQQWAPPQQPNSIWQPAGRQGDPSPSWDQSRMAWAHWQQAPQQAHMPPPQQQQQQQQTGMWSWEHHGPPTGNQWSAQATVGGGEQTASAGASMAL